MPYTCYTTGWQYRTSLQRLCFCFPLWFCLWLHSAQSRRDETPDQIPVALRQLTDSQTVGGKYGVLFGKTCFRENTLRYFSLNFVWFYLEIIFETDRKYTVGTVVISVFAIRWLEACQWVIDSHAYLALTFRLNTKLLDNSICNILHSYHVTKLAEIA